MTHLFIDPGTSYVGWAEFHSAEKRLLACGVTDARECPDLSSKIKMHRMLLDELSERDGRTDTPYQLIVCERMVCRYGNAKGDVQDIIDVNLVAGALGRDVWVTPGEWKGSVPRNIEQQRTLEALTTSEQELLPKRTKTGPQHNAYSAVGIGLYWFGRAHNRRRQ